MNGVEDYSGPMCDLGNAVDRLTFGLSTDQLDIADAQARQIHVAILKVRVYIEARRKQKEAANAQAS